MTNGKRRYGNILFEICHELVYSGKRGRPPKVLRQGVKIRLKNKENQSNKGGSKRPKYEAPHSEHPKTNQNFSDTNIHANHTEAFNAPMRRRNYSYRRKTNTYAKKKTALQRTLDIFWITHNFIREHFTTKQVPAVALGILDKGLSWERILKIQKLPKPRIIATQSKVYERTELNQCPLGNWQKRIYQIAQDFRSDSRRAAGAKPAC
uniref:Uncharacterized protein n=1 Tax=Candidatus Kentrum sp. FM TaxID=2126340 RepID=A0A450TKJ9_9GAMM|nr:MAG: hypothetical protein BECKFM1743C_GA0114222_104762 [Candidatus Kentron sp. FM]